MSGSLVRVEAIVTRMEAMSRLILGTETQGLRGFSSGSLRSRDFGKVEKSGMPTTGDPDLYGVPE